MIFEGQPTDWRDLEAKVCQVFNECGCEATCNQTLETVRGSVNVEGVDDSPGHSGAPILALAEDQQYRLANSIYYLFSQATSYRAMLGEVVRFPLEGIDPGEYDGPDRNITFPNARSYFDTMLAAAPQAVAGLRALHSGVPPRLT